MGGEDKMAEHVFVCYSRQDEDFVLELVDRLKDECVPMWIDQYNIQASENWVDAIDEALLAADAVLIVLSPTSVASPEVRSELRLALDEGKVVVPVLYRNCRIPRHLREIEYIDYRITTRTI
jgi:hypothetical protein